MFKAKETVTVTFVASGPGPDVACRLKRLLKGALRCYGLRCVESFYSDDMTVALAGRLSAASEVLGAAAERLEGQQRKVVAKRLRAVKADVDLARKWAG